MIHLLYYLGLYFIIIQNNGSALMHAAMLGNAKVAQYLIDNGGDINMVDSVSTMRLSSVCMTSLHSSRFSSVHFLVQNGNSALHFARNNEVKDILIQQQVSC
jgi:ankyrin repeat protein